MSLDKVEYSCLYSADFEYEYNYEYDILFLEFKRKLYVGLILDGLKGLMDLNYIEHGEQFNIRKRHSRDYQKVVLLNIKMENLMIDLGYWNKDESNHVCKHLYHVIMDDNNNYVNTHVDFTNDNNKPKLLFSDLTNDISFVGHSTLNKKKRDNEILDVNICVPL
eukprot:GHVR01059172.1.p1 GENE.GHVR01059172.1~~GHVR01059172.1.p1  ORF type:complete len:164 (+),score=25.39 GHVR01059172.1:608-1099(+)